MTSKGGRRQSPDRAFLRPGDDWTEGRPTFPGCSGRYEARSTHRGLFGNPVRAQVPPKAAGPVDGRLGGAGVRPLSPFQARLSRRFPPYPPRTAPTPAPAVPVAALHIAA